MAAKGTLENRKITFLVTEESLTAEKTKLEKKMRCLALAVVVSVARVRQL